MNVIHVLLTLFAGESRKSATDHHSFRAPGEETRYSLISERFKMTRRQESQRSPCHRREGSDVYLASQVPKSWKSQIMNHQTSDTPQPPVKKGLNTPQVLLVVAITIVVTAGLSYWLLGQYVFPREFKPVELRAGEERALNEKLRVIGFHVQDQGQDGPLRPEPYSENDATREITFSERELNAMLAKNTDLADRMAVDLSDDLISVLLLVPMDETFPVLGGRTLRLHAGVEFSYRDNRPIVLLKGVSLMGVPIPNAWLGNLKNVDLVEEFGDDQGFWQDFADGVEDIQVRNGALKVRLKE